MAQACSRVDGDVAPGPRWRRPGTAHDEPTAPSCICALPPQPRSSPSDIRAMTVPPPCASAPRRSPRSPACTPARRICRAAERHRRRDRPRPSRAVRRRPHGRPMRRGRRRGPCRTERRAPRRGARRGAHASTAHTAASPIATQRALAPKRAAQSRSKPIAQRAAAGVVGRAGCSGLAVAVAEADGRRGRVEAHRAGAAARRAALAQVGLHGRAAEPAVGAVAVVAAGRARALARGAHQRVGAVAVEEAPASPLP